MNAKEIIQKHYGKSNNFMTPDVIKYGKIGQSLAYELSSGKGFTGNTIYGLSFAHETEGRKNDLSTCLHSIKEVENYIESLK